VGRTGIESAELTSKVIDVARLCQQKGLDFVVGGAVSIDALPNLKKVREVYLTRFETRKVIFGAAALDTDGVHDGLLNAVHFELLWLLNKREYYGTIHSEDDKRIEMLETRWRLLNQS
jgi:hypothetical protein